MPLTINHYKYFTDYVVDGKVADRIFKEAPVVSCPLELCSLEVLGSVNSGEKEDFFSILFPELAKEVR